MKKIRRYLKSLGWKRDKNFEELGFRYVIEHPKHGEYSLFFKEGEYLLTDDSDELEYDGNELTKEIVDRLYREFINLGVKSY